MRKMSRVQLRPLLGTIVVGIALVMAGFTPASAQVGQTFYVDCAAGNDAAAGTMAAPWRTLNKVNSVTFTAGTTINLRRGTTCAGTLTPKGSGTATSPIRVNAYGTGALPKIVAKEARAAVTLRNVQGWELRNLDITDTGDAGPTRAGIYVEASDFGVATHFVIDSVVVHDVNGCDCTGYTDLSGGILFQATGTAVPTGFDDIKVTHNTVKHVDGIGIGTASHWAKRTLLPDGPGKWVPITRVEVSGNTLSDLGGDGIVIQNGSGAVVNMNVVDGFALRASAFHSGIWPWNSDNTTIQYNEIAHGGGALPALAMDLDTANDGTTYQYNYTHNNGGMLLACADVGSRNSLVQYNYSYDDLDTASGVIIFACNGPHDNLVFANNMVCTTAATVVANYSALIPAAMTNNVFVGAPAGSSFNDPYSHYSGNTFTNILNPPAQS